MNTRKREEASSSYERGSEDRDLKQHIKQELKEYTQTMMVAKIDWKGCNKNYTNQVKLFFSYMKSKTKSRPHIIPIKDNNSVYTKEDELCEILNERLRLSNRWH